MNQNFQLNLTGYEKAQLTKYDDDCFYEWHTDAFNDDNMPTRKLSAILQLSKPEDYKGCELQLFNGTKEPEELPIKNQGSVIVFKSDEWHRVSKLTDGVRYSVVMWATGARLT
jgi:PKHD-type hydroxylase